MILIKISFRPARSPLLFAYYLMDENKFNMKYLKFFKTDETISLQTTGDKVGKNFNLELYLGNCQVQKIRDKETINSYKMLHEGPYFGNFNLLEYLEENYSYLKIKRRRKKRAKIVDKKDPPPDIDFLIKLLFDEPK